MDWLKVRIGGGEGRGQWGFMAKQRGCFIFQTGTLTLPKCSGNNTTQGEIDVNFALAKL